MFANASAQATISFGELWLMYTVGAMVREWVNVRFRVMVSVSVGINGKV